MFDATAYLVVSLVALGMGLAFVSADRNSPTSRALAAAFIFLGLALSLNVVLPSAITVPADAWWSGLLALPEAGVVITVLEWLLRVRRMLPVPDGMDSRFGDRVLRSGQLGGLLYGLLSLLWPQIRLRDFLHAGLTAENLLAPGFWLFALPLMYAIVAGLAGIILLLARRPDPAERMRVLAMAAAVPFITAGAVLSLKFAAISVCIGELIFLIGATQYHVLQGQRGQFMSRFLSPQVAKLVAEKGLDKAMQENLREISVVCCDLRGFTPYAAAQPSTQVLQVLREYYDAVGAVVSEYGATIKDFAGDGILILVGAPLPVPYHARRALDMAARIRAVGLQLTPRWSSATHPLGIGVGVATGMVTVGVIGSASRLEYTAVGSAVNLASRLCEQAGNGEILLDAHTAEMAGLNELQSLGHAPVKGFSEPVLRYALPG